MGSNFDDPSRRLSPSRPSAPTTQAARTGRIMHLEGDGLFLKIWIVHNRENFVQVETNLKNLAAKAFCGNVKIPQIRNLARMQKVCVNIEGSWFRAEILAIQAPQSVLVHLIDYGSRCEVVVENIRTFKFVDKSDPVIQLPPLAACFILAGVRAESDTWSPLLLKYVQKLALFSHISYVVADQVCGLQMVNITLKDHSSLQDWILEFGSVQLLTLEEQLKLAKDYHSLEKVERSGQKHAHRKEVENVTAMCEGNAADKTRTDDPRQKLPKRPPLAVGSTHQVSVLVKDFPPDFVAFPRVEAEERYELLSSLQKSPLTPLKHQPNEGDLCLAFNDEEARCRGTIMGVDEVRGGNFYLVADVDNHSLMSVPIYDLYELPSLPIFKMRSAGFPLKLEGAEGLPHTEQIKNWFTSMCIDHVMQVDITSSLDENGYQSCHLSDSSGNDIFKKLLQRVNHNNANFRRIELEFGTFHNVTVCHVEKNRPSLPWIFYVHLLNERENLDALTKSINDFCNKQPIPEVIPAEVNRPIFAQYEDGLWYRAKLISKMGQQSGVVYFVDYGSECQVALEQTRDARCYPHVMQCPALAIKCRLRTVDMDVQYIGLFHKLTSEAPPGYLSMKVLGVLESGETLVSMMCQHMGSLIDVARHLLSMLRRENAPQPSTHTINYVPPAQLPEVKPPQVATGWTRPQHPAAMGMPQPVPAAPAVNMVPRMSPNFDVSKMHYQRSFNVPNYTRVVPISNISMVPQLPLLNPMQNFGPRSPYHPHGTVENNLTEDQLAPPAIQQRHRSDWYHVEKRTSMIPEPERAFGSSYDTHRLCDDILGVNKSSVHPRDRFDLNGPPGLDCGSENQQRDEETKYRDIGRRVSPGDLGKNVRGSDQEYEKILSGRYGEDPEKTGFVDQERPNFQRRKSNYENANQEGNSLWSQERSGHSRERGQECGRMYSDEIRERARPPGVGQTSQRLNNDGADVRDQPYSTDTLQGGDAQRHEEEYGRNAEYSQGRDADEGGKYSSRGYQAENGSGSQGRHGSDTRDLHRKSFDRSNIRDHKDDNRNNRGSALGRDRKNSGHGNVGRNDVSPRKDKDDWDSEPSAPQQQERDNFGRSNRSPERDDRDNKPLAPRQQERGNFGRSNRSPERDDRDNKPLAPRKQERGNFGRSNRSPEKDDRDNKPLAPRQQERGNFGHSNMSPRKERGDDWDNKFLALRQQERGNFGRSNRSPERDDRDNKPLAPRQQERGKFGHSNMSPRKERGDDWDNKFLALRQQERSNFGHSNRSPEKKDRDNKSWTSRQQERSNGGRDNFGCKNSSFADEPNRREWDKGFPLTSNQPRGNHNSGFKSDNRTQRSRSPMSQVQDDGCWDETPSAVKTAKSLPPLAHKQYPLIPLAPGAKIQGYVVLTISPNEFFIHLADNGELLELIAAQVTAAVAPGGGAVAVSPDGLQYKDACLAKYSVDQEWYRAQVISSKEQQTAEVYFVDYGNSECVKVIENELRSVPEELVKIPVQALRCRLRGAKPPNNALEWSPDAVNVFETTVLDKTLEIELVALEGLRCQHFSVILRDGDSCLNEQFGSTLESLATTSKLPEQPLLNPGTPVAISYYLTPESFFVIEDSLRSGLQELQEELGSMENETPLSSVQPGDLVLVPRESSIHRGVVKAVRDTKAKVYFLDIGIFQITEMAKLLPMPESVRKVPAFALPCMLAGVEPQPGPQWPKNSPEILNVFRSHPIFLLTPFGEPKQGVWTVSLVPDSGFGTSVAEELIQKGLAKPLAPEDLVPGGKCPVDVCYAEPSELPVLYVHRVSDLEKFAALQDELNSSIESLAPETESLNLGAAMNSSENQWCRALQVSATTDDGTRTVFFIDFGSTEVICDLKQLPPLMLTIPPFAHKCRLPIKPLEESFPPEFFARFKDLILTPPTAQVLCKTDEGLITHLFVGQINIVETLISEKLAMSAIDQAYICSYESSSCFYLQSAAVVPQLGALEGRLSEEQFEELTEPEVNLVCLAKFSEDECWYRAHVLSLKEGGGGASVLFIDYGNTADATEFKKIPEDVTSIPPCATKCALYRQPSNEQEKELFGAIAMDGTILYDILFLQDGPPALVIVMKNGKDVMIRPENSTLEEQKVEDPPGPATEQQETVLEVETTEHLSGCAPITFPDINSVYVSHYISPMSLWCQRAGDIDKIKAVNCQLANLPGEELTNLEEGKCYAIKFNSDQVWYRGVVETVDPLTVFFVDYGNTGSGLAVKPLPKDLDISQVPPMAQNYSLKYHPTPVDKDFESLTGMLGDTIQINIPYEALISEHEIIIYSDGRNLYDLIGYQPKGVTRDFTICAHESFESFYVQMVDQGVELNKVTTLIESGQFEDLPNVELGMRVLAKFLDDGIWYRALVTHATEDSTRVYFLDYGNTAHASEFKRLTPELRDFPPLAHHCKLEKPPVAEEVCKSLQVMMMQEGDRVLQAKFAETLSEEAWHSITLLENGKELETKLDAIIFQSTDAAGPEEPASTSAAEDELTKGASLEQAGDKLATNSPAFESSGDEDLYTTAQEMSAYGVLLPTPSQEDHEEIQTNYLTAEKQGDEISDIALPAVTEGVETFSPSCDEIRAADDTKEVVPYDGSEFTGLAETPEPGLKQELVTHQVCLNGGAGVSEIDSKTNNEEQLQRSPRATDFRGPDIKTGDTSQENIDSCFSGDHTVVYSGDNSPLMAETQASSGKLTTLVDICTKVLQNLNLGPLQEVTGRDDLQAEDLTTLDLEGSGLKILDESDSDVEDAVPLTDAQVQEEVINKVIARCNSLESLNTAAIIENEPNVSEPETEGEIQELSETPKTPNLSPVVRQLKLSILGQENVKSDASRVVDAHQDTKSEMQCQKEVPIISGCSSIEDQVDNGITWLSPDCDVTTPTSVGNLIEMFNKKASPNNSISSSPSKSPKVLLKRSPNLTIQNTDLKKEFISDAVTSKKGRRSIEDKIVPGFLHCNLEESDSHCSVPNPCKDQVLPEEFTAPSENLSILEENQQQHFTPPGKRGKIYVQDSSAQTPKLLPKTSFDEKILPGCFFNLQRQPEEGPVPHEAKNVDDKSDSGVLPLSLNGSFNEAA